jgi:hypothetical protein
MHGRPPDPGQCCIVRDIDGLIDHLTAGPQHVLLGPIEQVSGSVDRVLGAKTRANGPLRPRAGGDGPRRHICSGWTRRPDGGHAASARTSPSSGRRRHRSHSTWSGTIFHAVYDQILRIVEALTPKRSASSLAVASLLSARITCTSAGSSTAAEWSCPRRIVTAKWHFLHLTSVVARLANRFSSPYEKHR